MPAGAAVPMRGPDALATQRALDPGLTHQPGSLVTANVDPGAPGGLPQLPRPIDLIVGLPQLHQPQTKLSVAHSAPGRRPVPSGVVGARSHLQHLTDGLDSEPSCVHNVVLVGVDERHYLRCWRSSSAPKKVAARRRISLARRSSRTSCSRSLTRSASLELIPGRTPSSISACRTHERTDSTPYPNCSATRRTAP